MGRVVGDNSFSLFEVRFKCSYIQIFTHMHHILSKVCLVKLDTEILRPMFNVQMEMISEYKSPFL